MYVCMNVCVSIVWFESDLIIPNRTLCMYMCGSLVFVGIVVVGSLAITSTKALYCLLLLSQSSEILSELCSLLRPLQSPSPPSSPPSE